MGGGNHEPVTGATVEPGLHLIGDIGTGSHEARPLEQSRPVAGQITQRHGVATDVLS